MTNATCPSCGKTLEVYHADEGTCSYVPCKCQLERDLEAARNVGRELLDPACVAWRLADEVLLLRARVAELELEARIERLRECAERVSHAWKFIDPGNIKIMSDAVTALDDALARAESVEQRDALRAENKQLRVAMAAQDERERQAGERCGVEYELSGCDWPAAVADEVLSWRAEVMQLQSALREAYSLCPECGSLVACSYNVTESEIEAVDVVERVAELEARQAMAAEFFGGQPENQNHWTISAMTRGGWHLRVNGQAVENFVQLEDAWLKLRGLGLWPTKGGE